MIVLYYCLSSAFRPSSMLKTDFERDFALIFAFIVASVVLILSHYFWFLIAMLLIQSTHTKVRIVCLLDKGKKIYLFIQNQQTDLIVLTSDF